MFASILALTASLAATASADCTGPYFNFYNRAGSALSYQRLDPAIFPGIESPHLHSYDGGNGLAATMDYDTAQGSSCTTARIKQDKSLYWRPSLFWNGNNTGFYRVPDKFLKVYYKFGDSGNVYANTTAFPENFKMIAGNPFKRSDDGNNPAGIQWSCKGTSGSIDATGFPSGFTSCPNGFASQITFPSCWNGDDLNPAKPAAHMAWPTAGGTGINACPSGFQVARFPTIFIEFWYDISAFDGQYSADSVPWVLAQGDPTGFGFHSDFYNGWEDGVLEKAIAPSTYCDCGCGCSQDSMKTCFGDDNVYEDNDADFLACAASPVYGGDSATVVSTLPGCNPVQSGPATATVASGAACTAVASSAAADSTQSGSATLAQRQVAKSSSLHPVTAAPSAPPVTLYTTVTTTVTVRAGYKHRRHGYGHNKY